MALDYHIRSREIDVNDTATEELSNLNGDVESKNAAITVRSTFCLPRLSLYSEECVAVSRTFACRSKIKILATFKDVRSKFSFLPDLAFIAMDTS